MRKMSFLAGCLLLALWGLTVPGRTDQAAVTVEKDAEKTAQDTGKYMEEKREDFVKRIRGELSDLRAKITEQERKIGTETNTTGKKVEKDLRKQVKNLHRRERDLQRKLDRVDKISEAQLRHVKTDINNDLDKLKKGYDKLLDSMKVK